MSEQTARGRRSTYGLLSPSTHLSSNLLLSGRCESTSLTGVSLLLVPQQTYVPPDQIPSSARRYEAGRGMERAWIAGRWVRREERKDASSEFRFGGCGCAFFSDVEEEFCDWGLVEAMEMCVCAALPATVGKTVTDCSRRWSHYQHSRTFSYTRGDNVARQPYLLAVFVIISLVANSASAASRGVIGPVTTSYCTQSSISAANLSSITPEIGSPDQEQPRHDTSPARSPPSGYYPQFHASQSAQ